jgi:hypothetical protein
MEEQQQETPFFESRAPLPIAGRGIPSPMGTEKYLEDTEGGLSFTEAVSKGATDNWLGFLVSNQPSDTVEEGWEVTPERISELNKTFKGNEALIDDVLEARSEIGYQERLKRAQDRLDTIDKLGKSGFSKQLAYIVTGAFDPAEIAASIAVTGGLGAIPGRLNAAAKGFENVKRIQQAERLRETTNVGKRAAIGFTEGLVVGGGAEFLRNELRPDPNDDAALFMAVAGGFGAATEAGAAYWGRMKRAAAYQKRLALVNQGMPLTEAEKVLYKDIIEDQNLTTLQNTLARGEKLEAMEGLAAKPFNSNKLDDYEDATRQLGANKFGFGALRRTVSSVAQAMNSEVGAVRDLVQRLALNSSGNVDRSAVRFSASEIQQFYQNTTTAKKIFEQQKLRNEWIKEKYGNLNTPWDEGKYVREFNELVTKARRRGGKSSDARITRAAELEDEGYSFLWNEGVNYKARGFSKEGFQKDYAPRIYDFTKINRLREQYGEEALVLLFRQAFINKVEKLTTATATQAARAMVRGLVDRAAKVGDNGITVRVGVREDTFDDIRRALKAQKLDDAEIENVIYQLNGSIGKRETGEGAARTRSRVDLDELTEITLGDGNKISFEDILTNDFEDLWQMYSFQVGGAIGLARNGLEMEGQESFEAIMDSIRRDGLNKSLYKDDAGQARLESDIAQLKFLYDGITGQLAHSGNTSESTEQMLRRVREYGFIVSMGQAGLSSAIEAANVILEHNVASIIKGVPRLREIIKKMKSGDLEDPLFREMMHLSGTGIDMATGRIMRGFDDTQADYIKSDYGRVDAMLAYTRNKVAVYSGMLPMTAMLRRADSMFYAMDWFDAAQKSLKKGDYKAPFSKIKMEQMGINDEAGALITKMINKYAEKDSKGRLKTLNSAKWIQDGAEGKKALDAFSLSAQRHILQSVQETNLGSVKRFTRSPWGKTIFQFLSYVLGSQEQQFQRLYTRAAYGDAKNVGMIMLGASFMATMVYLSRVHYNALGKDEATRRKDLEEKLHPWRIARDGALSNMGMFSIFGTIAQRVNGNNLIMNPTASFAQNILSAAKNVAFDSARGDTVFDQERVQQLTRLLPFQNMFPVVPFKNAFIEQFPEK